MDKRTRIGLLFSYDERWIAGAYYILNLIHALKTLDVESQPLLVILTDSEENFQIVKKETNYPYLEFNRYPLEFRVSFYEKLINKLSVIISGKQLIRKGKVQPIIDFLYPYALNDIRMDGLKKINWVPDFQEAFYPKFFSQEEIGRRQRHQKNIVCEGDIAVFSSNDVAGHYSSLYPMAKAEKFVMPFAVTHPDISNLSISYLLKKFEIQSDYFFVPNQFWAHKNHEVVIKAVGYLMRQNHDVTILFSGKEHDHRNQEHVSSLKDLVKEQDIELKIKFLGFLERKEQLCLMKGALAIIQPSLFEGWSTVVEDAKLLNKHVILSDIPVHREQLQTGVSFFNPLDYIKLASLLMEFNPKLHLPAGIDYRNEVKKFAHRFLELTEM